MYKQFAFTRKNSLYLMMMIVMKAKFDTSNSIVKWRNFRGVEGALKKGAQAAGRMKGIQ